MLIIRIMEMSNGPWKEIFKGLWSNYEVIVYENPDKIVLTNIYEEKQGAIVGIVSILNKFFVFEGNASRLGEKTRGFSVIFEKHYPGFTAKYYSVSTGPRFSKPDLLNDNLREAFDALNKEVQATVENSRILGIDLIDLKNADERYSEKLLSEPILLQGMMMRTTLEGAPSTKAFNTIIGKKLTGEIAEEEVQGFIRSVMIGTDPFKKQVAQVVMENCVLAGVNSIIFDDKDNFTRMNLPNSNFDMKTYSNLQPIGMPIRTFQPQEIKIDLNLLNKELFREILKINGNLGEESAQLLDDIIEKHELKTLEDIEEKLLTITIEAKKFHMYRAIRWIRVIKNQYPELFAGKTNLEGLIPKYMRSMGSITRIDLSGLSPNIKTIFIYSIMKSLVDSYKEKRSSGDMKVISFLLNAEKHVPERTKKESQRALVSVVQESSSYGVGFCLGTPNENILEKDFVHNNTIRFDYIKQKEVAVKPLTKRAYRMSLRPTLSS